MVFFMGRYLGQVVAFYSDCVQYATFDPDYGGEVHDVYQTRYVEIVCPD